MTSQGTNITGSSFLSVVGDAQAHVSYAIASRRSLAPTGFRDRLGGCRRRAIFSAVMPTKSDKFSFA